MPQHAVGTPGGGVDAAAQDHGAAGSRLDHAACPAHHLQAGAVAAAHEGEEVLLQAALTLVALHVLVHQGPAHVCVAGVVAAAHHNAHLGVVLDDLAVGVLCDDAHHVAVVVLHQDLSSSAVVQLSAVVLHSLVQLSLLHILQHAVGSHAVHRLCAVGAHELDGCGPGAGAGLAGVVGLIQAVVDVVAGCDLVVIRVQMDDGPAVLGVVVGVNALVHAHLLADVQHVVQGLTGVLHIQADDARVGAAAAAGDELVGDLTQIPCRDARILCELGVPCADVLAVPCKVVLGLGLDAHDLCTLLGSAQNSSHACVAQTHDAHVAVHFAVHAVEGGSFAQPVAGAGVTEHTAVCLGGSAGLAAGIVAVISAVVCSVAAGQADGLLDAVCSGFLDGIGGDGCTGHAVDLSALGIHQHGLEILGRVDSQLEGLIGGVHLDLGDGGLGEGHGDGDVVHALCGGSVGACGIHRCTGSCGGSGSRGAGGVAGRQSTGGDTAHGGGSGDLQKALARDLFHEISPFPFFFFFFLRADVLHTRDIFSIMIKS